ncbi:MAG: hypothetical protein EOO47_02250 [Flavobacterium sp.]|nr:MAG: hypothetical protein EOO47_02250 [Flavobacterium sp.]
MSVLSRIVAMLLLFLMMFCITKNSALYTFYSLNTDAFVSLFCENVNKPALKCNGKCQLSKMAKDEQKAQAEKVLSSLAQEVFLFHQHNEIENSPLTPVIQIAVNLTVFPKENYSYLYFSRNDKPPQFLS